MTVPDEGFRKGGVGVNAEPTKPLPDNPPSKPEADPRRTCPTCEGSGTVSAEKFDYMIRPQIIQCCGGKHG
jgi:hypothetical protein